MQLFAIKPCERYAGLSSKEFAEKYSSTMKAKDEDIQLNERNVAVLVSFLMF